jgi:hypothetical protein
MFVIIKLSDDCGWPIIRTTGYGTHKEAVMAIKSERRSNGLPETDKEDGRPDIEGQESYSGPSPENGSYGAYLIAEVTE